MGQYTQVDPIGLAGENPTLYGYVYNPFADIDPFGLKCKVNVTAGKNYKDHFIRHKKLLEQVTGNKYLRFKTHGQKFLDDIAGLINSGKVKFAGQGTVKKGQPVVDVFKGEGVTILLKPNGEFITILQSGKGMDLAIQFVKTILP